MGRKEGILNNIKANLKKYLKERGLTLIRYRALKHFYEAEVLSEEPQSRTIKIYINKNEIDEME